MNIRKYTLHVLVLIALIVVLSPAKAVKASSGENCSDHELSTKEACEGAGYIWTPDSPASVPATSKFCDPLTSSSNVQVILIFASCVINSSVIPLIFALAVAMFVWGVVQFVINSEDEAKKTKGKQFMIWGIIALAVMVSVWGLVHILGNTFGIQTIIPQTAVPK